MSIPVMVALGSSLVLVLILAIFMLIRYIKHVLLVGIGESSRELLATFVMILLLSLYISMFFISPYLMAILTMLFVAFISVGS